MDRLGVVALGYALAYLRVGPVFLTGRLMTPVEILRSREKYRLRSKNGTVVALLS